MPCYTVRLVSVIFKAQNEGILKQAAEALGWGYSKQGNTAYIGAVTVDLNTQTAQAYDQSDINALKRAYSQAAVKQAARAKGWTLDSWKVAAGVKTTVATKY